MKDRIIEKKGKKYLASEYNSCNWLFHLGWIVMVLMSISMVEVWIDSPVDGQDSYYLEINDAGEDVFGYYVVGDLYRLESLKNGGMHPIGKEASVPISEFVYRQIEEGNLISLAGDENENYQYAGDIYSSPSSTSLPSPFHTLDEGGGLVIILVFCVVLIPLFMYCLVHDTRSSSRIITIDDFNVCYKRDRWYGVYNYGRAKVDGSDSYEMIRIRDAWMFLNLDIENGDSIVKGGGRFYTVKSRFKRIKSVDNHIEKLMDVEANQ